MFSITVPSVHADPGRSSPDYFPSVSFAALILASDTLVLADTWQYVRQSNQNRARIRNPDGVQWMTVPLERGAFGRAVSEIRMTSERRGVRVTKRRSGSTMGRRRTSKNTWTECDN